MLCVVEGFPWCTSEYIELEKSMPNGPSKDLLWYDFWNSVNLDMHIYGKSLIWKIANALGNTLEVRRLALDSAIPQPGTIDYPDGYYRISIGRGDMSGAIPAQQDLCVEQHK